MTADDNTSPPAARVAQPLERSRRRLRSAARRGLWKVARPYARRRARRADAAARLGRLEAGLKRVSERHGEQIERLEDLVRELVLTAESLRRETSRLDAGVKEGRPPAPRDGGAEG